MGMKQSTSHESILTLGPFDVRTAAITSFSNAPTLESCGLDQCCCEFKGMVTHRRQKECRAKRAQRAGRTSTASMKAQSEFYGMTGTPWATSANAATEMQSEFYGMTGTPWVT